MGGWRLAHLARQRESWLCGNGEKYEKKSASARRLATRSLHGAARGENSAKAGRRNDGETWRLAAGGESRRREAYK